MRSLELDHAGDIVVRNYSLSVVDTARAVEQAIQSRLRLFLGEWFLNTSRGVEYFEQILIKQPNRANVQSIIKREILLSPRVLSIESFEMFDSPDAERQLGVRFSIRVDFQNDPLSLEVTI